MDDIVILEESGNTFVNTVFEANLSNTIFDKNLVVDDTEEEDTRRGKFIKQKYKKRKYFDEVIYHKEVLKVLQRKHEERQSRAEEERRQSRRNRDDETDSTKSLSNVSSPHSVNSNDDLKKSAGDKRDDRTSRVRHDRLRKAHSMRCLSSAL